MFHYFSTYQTFGQKYIYTNMFLINRYFVVIDINIHMPYKLRVEKAAQQETSVSKSVIILIGI